MSNFLDIKANDNHPFSAYLAQPKDKPKAGVVILQEIFGVNVHIQEVADLFAQNGYLAIAPSLFDRKERNVQLGYDKDGVAKGRELKDLCDKTSTRSSSIQSRDITHSNGVSPHSNGILKRQSML